LIFNITLTPLNFEEEKGHNLRRS